MENNEHKRLDKLFRSRFGKNTPANNGWNVPPTDLFDKAMADFEGKEEKKRRYWLPFFLTIAAVGIFVLAIRNQQMISKLSHQVEILKNEPIGSNPSKNNIQPTDTGNQEVIEKNDAIIQNKIIQASPQRLNNKTSASIAKPSLSFSQTKHLPGSLHNSNNVDYSSNIRQTNLSENASFAQNDAVVIDNESGRLNKLAPLSSLPIDLIDKTDNILPLNFTTNKSGSLNNKKNPRFATHLLIGYNLSSFNMSNAAIDDATLSNYDKNYFGYQIGLGIDHRLSPKWYLNYTFSYKNIANKSVYEEQMSYDASNENMNSEGTLVYTSTLRIATPMEAHVDKMEMSVEENEMSEGDILKNTTQIRQRFHIMNASAAINYIPWHVGKWAVIINGGLSINRIFRIKESMDTQIHFDEKLMMEKSSAKYSNFDKNRLYYTGFAGIGLQYNLSNRFSIILDNNFERSFTSLRSNQALDKSSTKLNSLNFGLRIGYKF